MSREQWHAVANPQVDILDAREADLSTVFIPASPTVVHATSSYFRQCYKHGDTFRAHARKFNHEVLRTVRMRTESETALVLYTVHVRTVNNEKRALLAVHAHGKQCSTSRYTQYTVRTCARNVTTCSVRTHEPQKPQTCSAPCASTETDSL